MVDLGFKLPIVLDMVRFMVARHRAFRQKISGQPKSDVPLLDALKATRPGLTASSETWVANKLEILRGARQIIAYRCI